MLEFSEKKVVGKVVTEVELTEFDIENIIVSSVEGGSNHWMGIDNTKPEFKDKPKDEPLSTWITKLLLEGKTVYFYDNDDGEGPWELTLEKLLKGAQQNAKERPFDSDKENWDADSADCIVQYALFDEVVYG